MGTNAELKAPSAKTRRKKLGKRKAAKNTSESKPTPMNLAIKTSRTKPRILDKAIKNETAKADLKRLMKNYISVKIGRKWAY